MRNVSSYTFDPIGWVENEFEALPSSLDFFKGSQSRIKVRPEFSRGLYQLENYPFVTVIFVFHLSKGYSPLVHPMGDRSRPQRGVFATHSPRRPNPIGLSVVELVEVEGDQVIVKELDVVNGTPVLDLKPGRSMVMRP